MRIDLYNEWKQLILGNDRYFIPRDLVARRLSRRDITSFLELRNDRARGNLMEHV